MKKVLTIAGSDPSGGAGIQADIKTITVHKMYAMSVITALTVQNTLGVYQIRDMEGEFVGQEMDAVFQDIVPDSVKIGMVSSAEIIEVLAQKLKDYQAKNIVLDPLILSSSGRRLISPKAQELLTKALFPLATIITPNMYEAEILAGFPILDDKDMERAGEKLGKTYACAFLIKGGHRKKDANDLLYTQGKAIWFRNIRIDNPNNHGTGCTLSSAIACNLAKGKSLEESVARAKNYLNKILSKKLNLGKGTGPMDHSAVIEGNTM